MAPREPRVFARLGGLKPKSGNRPESGNGNGYVNTRRRSGTPQCTKTVFSVYQYVPSGMVRKTVSKATRKNCAPTRKVREKLDTLKSKKRAEKKYTDEEFATWAQVQCVKAQTALQDRDHSQVARVTRAIAPALCRRHGEKRSPFYQLIRERLTNCVADLILFFDASEQAGHLLAPVLDILDDDSILSALVDPTLQNWRAQPQLRKDAPLRVIDDEWRKYIVAARKKGRAQLVGIIRHTRSYKKCVADNCGRFALRLVTQADAWGRAGVRCKMHGGQFQCAAEGCKLMGRRVVTGEDGTVKRFCNRHGQQCVMPNCGRTGVVKLSYQPPHGWRCRVHGGAKLCGIKACNNQSERRTTTSDTFGPPGQRCAQHGRVCTVAECQKRGHRLVPVDTRGPAGYRCIEHGGGHACSVEGCAARAVYKQFPYGDKFGAAGYRCGNHRCACVVEGCFARGRKLTQEDDIGPAGYRCYKHRAKT